MRYFWTDFFLLAGTLLFAVIVLSTRRDDPLDEVALRLKQQLLRIGRRADARRPRGLLQPKPWAEYTRHELRRIGVELHEHGGPDLMVRIFQEVRASLGAAWAREIEAAWRDIGDRDD